MRARSTSPPTTPRNGAARLLQALRHAPVFRVKQTGHYVLPVGLLQGGADWRLDAQIFVDAKPDFYSLGESPAMLTGAQFFAQHAPG